MRFFFLKLRWVVIGLPFEFICIPMVFRFPFYSIVSIFMLASSIEKGKKRSDIYYLLIFGSEHEKWTDWIYWTLFKWMSLCETWLTKMFVVILRCCCGRKKRRKKNEKKKKCRAYSDAVSMHVCSGCVSSCTTHTRIKLNLFTDDSIKPACIISQQTTEDDACMRFLAIWSLIVCIPCVCGQLVVLFNFTLLFDEASVLVDFSYFIIRRLCVMVVAGVAFVLIARDKVCRCLFFSF